jgi:exonuclease VII small subunit
VDDLWFLSPGQWETFLQTATPAELESVEEILPTTDPGNYRRVCLAIERSDFNSALELLETGGSFFHQNNYAVGLHDYVRQRLGLNLSLKAPRQGDDLAKEDLTYWYLAYALHNAEQKLWIEAKHWLFEATRQPDDLKMIRTTKLLKTIKTNLYQPDCGLPLVAPPHSVLASPKLFDTLRQDKTKFSRLQALGEESYLEPVQLCRYAQYLLYEEQYEQALVVIEKAKPQTNLLAFGIRMAILASLEWFDLLKTMIENFRPGSSKGLEAEGTMLAYEQCAFYFALVKGDHKLSYAYLHRAEALAIEHDLTYRLSVIRSHIEAVANMAGDTLGLDPLLESNSGTFKGKSVRNRYDSLLRANNLSEIDSFVKARQLEPEDLFLAQATLEYQKAERGKGHLHKVANLISDYVPEHPESKLFWSLLMLQVFSGIGVADGRANPERILTTLETALSRIEYLNSVVPVAANLYPQGLAVASHLYPRLESARGKVATVWSDDARDGLRLEGKKMITITKPIRDALILDDLYHTSEHLGAVIRRGTGHTYNKTRLERSLEGAKLKLHEITSVGGIYRGVYRLGRTLQDQQTLNSSETLRQSSQFLTKHVAPQRFTF